MEDRARELGLEIDLRQSNHEGHLIDWLHEAQAYNAKAVLLNAGAFTHTSLALYDAIKSIKTPVIEVHISNPLTREEFRHESFVGVPRREPSPGSGRFRTCLRLKLPRTSDKGRGFIGRQSQMTDKNNRTGAMQVDIDMVRQLAAVLDETQLTEIEVEDGERRIRVARTVRPRRDPAGPAARRRRRSGAGRLPRPPPLRPRLR
jgi:3-dehydroquinate dehydratase-2